MIIDTEVHILHPPVYESGFVCSENEPVFHSILKHQDYPLLQNKLTCDALLNSMNQAQIDVSFLMGMAWKDEGILKENNQYVKMCIEQNSEKFRGFYIPGLKDIRKAVREIYDLDTNIYKGIKIIPKDQGVHIDDPALDEILYAVQEKNLYLMVHTDHSFQSRDGDTPYRFYQMLKKHPYLHVLAPHLGGGIFIYALLEFMRDLFKNTFFITSVSATMDMVRFALDLLPRQVVFGTDFPFNHCHDQSTPLNALREMRLTLEARENVLWKTASILL